MAQQKLPYINPAVPQLFAGNAYGNPNNVIGVFGSATSTPAYTDSPAVIQNAAYSNGWASAVIGTNQPCIEDMNSLFYLFSYFITYLSQRGIPEWDSTGNTYYGLNAIVNNSNTNNGPIGIYVSQAGTSTNNTGLLTNPSAWLPLGNTITGSNICKAWVTFDAVNRDVNGNPTILQQSASIASVQYVATGTYLINFVNGTFTQANYSFSGSAGTRNGYAAVAGDNNVITGGVGTNQGIRSASQLQVYCWEPNRGSGAGQLEDSTCVSLMIFGN